MASKRKCPICGQLLGYEITDTEHVVAYKNRYAHVNCFNNMLKITNKRKKEELATKEKKKSAPKTKEIHELKTGLTEEEYKEKMVFFEKLKAVQKLSKLEAKHYKVAEDYLKKYKFTYPGMTMTLIYCFEVLVKTVKGEAIGIIPYKYSEAQEYFEKIKKAQEYNDIIIKETNNFEKVMYKKQTIKITPKKRVVKQIDISEIGGEIVE